LHSTLSYYPPGSANLSKRQTGDTVYPGGTPFSQAYSAVLSGEVGKLRPSKSDETFGSERFLHKCTILVLIVSHVFRKPALIVLDNYLPKPYLVTSFTRRGRTGVTIVRSRGLYLRISHKGDSCLPRTPGHCIAMTTFSDADKFRKSISIHPFFHNPVRIP
jgi:hypothetical protein